MRVVVQRVSEAKIVVDQETVASIQYGLVLLVGFTYGDTIEDIDYLVNKIINLRIFDDENKIMNRSIMDVQGALLSVSQFTLYANTKKGRRPSYEASLNSDEALPLYDLFNQRLKENKVEVQTGVFKADMQVALVNDGPVTIIIDSK